MDNNNKTEETMKVLIEIPVARYKAMQKCIEAGMTLSATDNAILNGTIIEPERIYGVSQSCYGHEYRWLYKESALREKRIPIPASGDIANVDFWPMSGSNVSTTFITPLEDDEAIRAFLLGTAELDFSDPMLADIAECCASINVDDAEWDACTNEYVSKLGISLADMNELYRSNIYTDTTERMVQALIRAGCERIDKNNPYYGFSSDMRYSELEKLYNEIVVK